MTDTLNAITDSIKINHPNLLEDGVTVVDFYFLDCNKKEEVPTKNLDAVKTYLTSKKITDFTIVILFSNNIIGYRLTV